MLSKLYTCAPHTHTHTTNTHTQTQTHTCTHSDTNPTIPVGGRQVAVGTAVGRAVVGRAAEGKVELQIGVFQECLDREQSQHCNGCRVYTHTYSWSTGINMAIG